MEIEKNKSYKAMSPPCIIDYLPLQPLTAWLPVSTLTLQGGIALYNKAKLNEKARTAAAERLPKSQHDDIIKRAEPKLRLVDTRVSGVDRGWHTSISSIART